MDLTTLVCLEFASISTFVVMLILSDWEDNGWKMFFGIISVIGSIVFSIMLYGYAACDWNQFKIQECQVEITKSDNRVFVEYDFRPYGFGNHGYKVFDTKEDYDNITDTTTFYILTGINHYGNEFEARLGFGDSLCNFEQNKLIDTPVILENKYDSNGGSLPTNYNSN